MFDVLLGFLAPVVAAVAGFLAAVEVLRRL